MAGRGANKDFPVSWEELHRHGRVLAWRLLSLGPFTGIVAVSRGGLVPAAIAARELDLRTVVTVCLASYDHKTRGTPELLHRPDIGAGAGWLIIDDLVDTGATARVVRELLPEAHFATIYAKPAGRPLVDTFVTEVSQDTWILFPWDVAPHYAEPIGRQR